MNKRKNSPYPSLLPQSRFNILESLDFVQEHAKDSQLSDDFWRECEEHIRFLSSRLELTKKQVVIIAIMAEVGDAMSWRHIGQFLDISRLKAMNLTSEIDDLKEKRWVYQHAALERGRRFDGFKLAAGVIRAFRNNEKFIPEEIDGLSEQVFVERITLYMINEGQDDNVSPQEIHRVLMQFTHANPHLPLCQQEKIMKKSSFMILLFTVTDYGQYADTDNEGITRAQLNSLFYDFPGFGKISESLQLGSHELFSMNLIEHHCDNGMVDENRYKLTSKAKGELLANYSPHMRHSKKRRKYTDRDLRKYEEINPKKLIYNAEEALQLERVRKLLSKDGFSNAQQRLSECGLRKGMAFLFYGAPGTGKTETVLQLARETGRNLMEVNIAGLRDKFVGESEKNIKDIFTRYKDLCQGSKETPILFFNEADAIINNRLETTQSSVEKMDNAIQNIILQEMENLEGILIATTNLTGTLDRAFDRRFLFKIEFRKPGIEAKSRIWRTMFPDLEKEESFALAAKFDFSGGQIENVARKCKIEYAITGEPVSISQIRDFCAEENINRASGTRIGF